MKTIPFASLIKFNPTHKKHLESYKKIKDYNFNTDFEIIKTFFKMTIYPNGIDIEYEYFDRFIVEDEFMVGIDFETDMLDDEKYLFDAFNVYFSNNNSEYVRDEKLTSVWRKLLKITYPNTTYLKDAQMHIQKEYIEDQTTLVNNFNKQQQDLLQ